MFAVLQRVVAAFYLYGALVHAANLLGFGFEIPTDKRVPFRLLDIGFLVLDVIVVVGLWRLASWGRIAFFIAALTQLVMYLVFTDYFITDEVQRGQLMGLVIFHAATATLMALFWILDDTKTT